MLALEALVLEEASRLSAGAPGLQVRTLRPRESDLPKPHSELTAARQEPRPLEHEERGGSPAALKDGLGFILFLFFKILFIYS